jgi:5-epi-alpha-selinene synthase
MNQFTLPELYCPFPSQINKYADVLEKYAIEWLLRLNLLTHESIYQRFCKSKFFFLSASVYPYCELEELKIANDWISWLFIWDDQCDMSDLGKQPDVLKIFHNRFLEILNGAELTSQDIPISRALSDLRNRMLQRGGAKTFHHFVRSLEDYFYGCFLEATNRVQGIVPNVDTYIKIRSLSAAADLCLTLIEFCDHVNISYFLRNHDIMKKLTMMSINIISWCNDIFSVFREMGSGDVHNLVAVLHYNQQLPLQEAIKYAAEMHDQEVRKMIDLEASLPSFGEETDPELTKCILGFHAWIRGNLDWYSHSGRYQNLQRLELVQS